MRNIIVRIVTFLTVLYEFSCYLMGMLFLALWGCEIWIFPKFLLVTFLYYLPMLFHLGVFGDKSKEIIDKVMMW